MTLDNEKLLDPTGWQILLELESNARLSFAELGRRVGLSLPAVAERVRRMEDAGIITGYQVLLDPTKIGRPISAFVRIRLHDHITGERLEQLLADLPEVLECHHIAGDEDFLLKVVAANPSDYEKFVLERLTKIAAIEKVKTIFVLSSSKLETAIPVKGGIEP